MLSVVSLRRPRDPTCLLRVLAGAPTRSAEDSLCVADRLRLQRRRHRIVESIQEAKQRNDGRYLDDLFVAPVRLQTVEKLVGDFIRHEACRARVIQCDLLLLGVERAALLAPDRCELALVDIEMQCAADLVCNAMTIKRGCTFGIVVQCR